MNILKQKLTYRILLLLIPLVAAVYFLADAQPAAASGIQQKVAYECKRAVTFSDVGWQTNSVNGGGNRYTANLTVQGKAVICQADIIDGTAKPVSVKVNGQNISLSSYHAVWDKDHDYFANQKCSQFLTGHYGSWNRTGSDSTRDISGRSFTKQHYVPFKVNATGLNVKAVCRMVPDGTHFGFHITQAFADEGSGWKTIKGYTPLP